ncbi:hypothetical protein V2G26_015700 [Clonostachys chloroleuca]
MSGSPLRVRDIGLAVCVEGSEVGADSCSGADGNRATGAAVPLGGVVGRSGISSSPSWLDGLDAGGSTSSVGSSSMSSGPGGAGPGRERCTGKLGLAAPFGLAVLHANCHVNLPISLAVKLRDELLHSTVIASRNESGVLVKQP